MHQINYRQDNNRYVWLVETVGIIIILYIIPTLYYLHLINIYKYWRRYAIIEIYVRQARGPAQCYRLYFLFITSWRQQYTWRHNNTLTWDYIPSSLNPCLFYSSGGNKRIYINIAVIHRNQHNYIHTPVSHCYDTTTVSIK